MYEILKSIFNGTDPLPEEELRCVAQDDVNPGEVSENAISLRPAEAEADNNTEETNSNV